MGEFNPGGKKLVNKAALAKMEYVLDQETMPPPRYVALHWDRGMSEKDEAAVEVRGAR